MTRLFAGTPFDRPPTCERCQRVESDCACPPEPIPLKPPEKQIARIRLEKRKNGKWVTTIRDLDPTGDHLAQLLTKLKKHCGAGGAIDENVLEIQGDHVQRITDFLKQVGYRIAK
ncbi:MAG: translation initiation factor [Planctomycetaceae bacterium]|nr:translation initiation factor [Planctomycetaceae bacterium]